MVTITLMGQLQTADGERLELVIHLDDRVGEDSASAASILSDLAAVSGDMAELRWGKRRFRGSLSELTVTETAFREDLEPIAATIRLVVDVITEEEEISVTVGGERWRPVPDLDRAGPNDRVYVTRTSGDGSLEIRFGDGTHGSRPPTGEISVRARYQVGGGQAGE